MEGQLHPAKDWRSVVLSETGEWKAPATTRQSQETLPNRVLRPGNEAGGQVLSATKTQTVSATTDIVGYSVAQVLNASCELSSPLILQSYHSRTGGNIKYAESPGSDHDITQPTENGGRVSPTPFPCAAVPAVGLEMQAVIR